MLVCPNNLYQCLLLGDAVHGWLAFFLFFYPVFVFLLDAS
jgi:hypothetical protein